nr:hypothetical protein DM860_006244 [Ipomoea batatas]
MDVESTFRVMFGVKKEQDMVELIEAAVSVASLIAPNKLKKHRSRIVKLLFDEDPANASHDLFSDDELGFDSDDDDEELLKVTSTPAKKTSNSPEIKKLGFKKCGEESQVVAPQMTPLKMEGRQEKSMEAPKKMLGRKAARNQEQNIEEMASPSRVEHPDGVTAETLRSAGLSAPQNRSPLRDVDENEEQPQLNSMKGKISLSQEGEMHRGRTSLIKEEEKYLEMITMSQEG